MLTFRTFPRHALAAALAFLLAPASALCFTVGDLDYEFQDGSDTEVGVFGLSNDSATCITIPSTVKYNSQTYRVTSIRVSAFHSCSSLTNVTIGDSVTSIGSEAFSGCSGLSSVTIGDSVTNIWSGAFYGCSGLTSVTIPGSVTSIGASAFQDCSGLTSVTIGDRVTNILSGAFYGCSSLTSVTIPGSVTSIGNWAFANCSGLTRVAIGNNVTNIGEWAFYTCSRLTSVTIGNSVTFIGKSAFSDCSGLANVTIPDSVTSIGASAFQDCSGLTNVTIGDSVTNIGDNAFAWSSALASVTIPDRVMSIGRQAFYYCNALASVTIGNGVTNIGDSAFSGCSSMEAFSVASGNPAYKSVDGLLLTKDGKTLLQGVNGDVVIPAGVTSIGSSAFYYLIGLTSVTIRDSVTNIDDSAFSYCRGLTSVTIPDSVTSIGRSVFYFCSALSAFSVASGNPSYQSVSGLLLTKDGKTLLYGVNGDVVIPESVTSIGRHAFYGCSGLTSVSIPSSVTSIGDYAFYYCRSLTSVTIPDSVTSIGNSMFDGCSGLRTLSVPGAWEGTTMLADASVPSMCVVVYRKNGGGLLPEVKTEAEVTVALAGAGDGRLVENIQTTAEYGEFREWAMEVKGKDGEVAGAEAVLASEHAWPSYLLGAEVLFENEPVIRLDGFSVNVVENGQRGDGVDARAITARVAVRDGTNVVTVNAFKVASLFTASGNLLDWEGEDKLEPVAEVIDTDTDGIMTFTLKAGDGTEKMSFFGIRE